MNEERGVSSVVGIILLLAITLTMVTSLLVIGTVAMNETQRDTQLSQMETSMAQMSSKASLTALGDAGGQRFDLGDIGDGQVEVREDAGSVSMMYNDTTENLTIFEDKPLGAIVYTQGDEEIAYQGGGVWRGSGDGHSHMVSPPEYHYVDETLTFPIVRIEGDSAASNRIQGQFTSRETNSIFPEPGSESLSNPIEEGEVWLEIESEYHHGWYQFFSSRSDGAVVHDEENRRVRVELSVPFSSEYSSAIAVSEGYSQQGEAADVDEADIDEGANYPSASEVIEQKIAQCEEEGTCLEWEDGIENGFYANNTYNATDDPGTDETIVFNVSEEDDTIDVVMEAGWDTEGEDIVVEGNGTVNFYFMEPPEFSNQEVNIEGDATQLFMYIHSDADEWDLGQNPTFTGVIYAPNTYIEFSGSNDFLGAIIAEELDYSGNIGIEFDESLSDMVDLGFDAAHDELRYLHVTENIVEAILD